MEGPDDHPCDHKGHKYARYEGDRHDSDHRTARAGIPGRRFTGKPLAVLGVPLDYPADDVAQARELLIVLAAHIGGCRLEVVASPQFHKARMTSQIVVPIVLQLREVGP